MGACGVGSSSTRGSVLFSVGWG